MSKHTLFKATRRFLSEHTPEILTGLGAAGVVVTAVFSAKATPKALKAVEEKKRELHTDKLPMKETIKCTWKYYVPAALSGAASIACILGSNTVHAKRYSALAAAYKLSETAIAEYREKVVETVGEKKEQEVREAIMREKVTKNPPSGSEIIQTGKGDTLCYDNTCGRYFYSSKIEIESIANVLNRKMNNGEEISLNDFYTELGLYPTDIGYTIGWRADWSLIKPHFTTQLADDGRTPCLVVGFWYPPKYGYDKY